MEHESGTIAAVRTSYEISLKIVQANHSFNDGDFVKSCILNAVKNLSNDELPKYEAISLSRHTVTRRVQEMAENVELQLKHKINSFIAVSLALDESTDVADTAQLAIFVRGVDSDLNVTEELLNIVPMKGTTTAGDIFTCHEDSAAHMGLQWKNLVCIATDGARSMTGCNSGLIARIRQKLKAENIDNNFVAVHCFIHQEALCAKSLALKNVMAVVVKCVNIMRAHGLKHRELRAFLETVGSEHTDIPYYCEVRWLSRGATLKRFFELRVHIQTFLEEKKIHCTELLDSTWIADLAFMADITQHLNVLNLELMGRNKLIFNMCDKIDSFKMKLGLWEKELTERNFGFFPSLQELSRSQNINTLPYVQEISDLATQFMERFAELVLLKPELETFAAPFAVDPSNAPQNLKMELIDLKCDTRLKNDYKDMSYMEFYKRLNPTNFPNLRAFAAKIIAMFGSTYSCEQFFSSMKLNKSRLRSQLSDTNLAAIMRLAAARDIEPDIAALILSKRVQTSSQPNN